jgi:hypothetical protein
MRLKRRFVVLDRSQTTECLEKAHATRSFLSRTLRLLTVSLLAAAAASPQARAQAVQTAYYDTNGMLRCLAHPTDPSKSVVFFWNEKNPYPRSVYAATFRQLQYLPVAQENDYFSKNCSTWQTYTSAVIQGIAWEGNVGTLVTPGTLSVEPDGTLFTWGSDIEARLAQVRLGSNVYHDFSGADYLVRYPLADYTREANRTLTKAYGIGFSADIYKAWLERLPRNPEFKSKIEKSIADIQRSGDRPLARRIAHYKVLIAQGFMQTAAKNRLQSLIDNLRGLGAEVKMMDFDPVGSIAANVPRFRDQINAELLTGQKVILISASKGAPELLTAISQINAANLTTPVPMRAPGQIAAVITLAGMIEGSFLPDWASGVPQRYLIKGSLNDGGASSGLVVTDLTGFFDMSTASLTKQREIYRATLPRVPYYSFVGVITRDGIARDPEINMLQKSLSIPHADFHGANDGYIEYPGTHLPRSWNLQSTDVVFDSSHSILDGFYYGRDMSQLPTRKLVIESIFQSILDDLGAPRQ